LLEERLIAGNGQQLLRELLARDGPQTRAGSPAQNDRTVDLGLLQMATTNRIGL